MARRVPRSAQTPWGQGRHGTESPGAKDHGREPRSHGTHVSISGMATFPGSRTHTGQKVPGPSSTDGSPGQALNTLSPEKYRA